VRAGCCLDGVDDADARFLQKLFGTDLRLLDDVHGAVFQGFERRFRSLFGQGGADDHGDGVLGHQFFQKGDAVHARHFHIQGDDVGDDRLHVFCRNVRIRGRADNSDGRVGGEQFRQGLPDHGGIVDNKDLDLVSHTLLLRVT